MQVSPETHAQLLSNGMVREGHFAFRSGRHSTGLIDRDLLLADPAVASRFGYAIAKHYFTDHIEIVATPSIWGAGLAQWVAYFLEPKARVVVATPKASGSIIAEKLVPLIADRRVLIVDNLIVSGDTMSRFAALVHRHGATVIGLATLWSTGDPEINSASTFAVLNSIYPAFLPEECPKCRAGARSPELVPY